MGFLCFILTFGLCDFLVRGFLTQAELRHLKFVFWLLDIIVLIVLRLLLEKTYWFGEWWYWHIIHCLGIVLSGLLLLFLLLERTQRWWLLLSSWRRILGLLTEETWLWRTIRCCCSNLIVRSHCFKLRSSSLAKTTTKLWHLALHCLGEWIGNTWSLSWAKCESWSSCSIVAKRFQLLLTIIGGLLVSVLLGAASFASPWLTKCKWHLYLFLIFKFD